MKLQLTSFFAFAATKMGLAIQATSDIYYHERTLHHLPKSMWIFSSEGLVIYSANGQQELLRHSAADLDCGDSCFYFDVVTDGNKYVWANALHSIPNRVDVFSLESGDYLGGVGICSTPLDMDFIPRREELWIRCAGSEDSPHLAVISTNTLGTPSDEIRLNEKRTYGYSVFHSTLGNYGYATGNDDNVLWKIDMANRNVIANFTLDNAHSAYEMTYSAVNKHVFLRSRVCCTCGFEGADAPTCGRFGGSPGQNIITGPSAGRSDLNGTCGVGCEGSLADTIGVMEFDTVSDTFVANHSPKIGLGATPEASPDGKYIVLFANDGGQNIRILQAGSNGSPSAVAFDIPVQFENVPPGREGVTDFAFCEYQGNTVLVLASGYDNNVVVIDLGATATGPDSEPTVSKVTISSSAAPTGEGGTRMVEWAYGSDYVWVDGSAMDEAYVLRLTKQGRSVTAVVDRTIPNLPSSKMIYVENFAQRATYNLLTQFLANSLAGDESNSESSSDNHISTTDALAPMLADLLHAEDEETASIVAITALIVGCLSLLMNIVGIMFYCAHSQKGNNVVNGGPSSNNANDMGVEGISDDKTLGSKQVA